MRQHGDETSWIAYALRGPALWAIAVALKRNRQPAREFVNPAWLQDQRHCFIGSERKSGKAKENRDAHRHRHSRRVVAPEPPG